MLNSTLATEPILLSRSAHTNLISLVVVYDVPHLWESPVGPTISQVSFPSIHTDAGVAQLRYHTAVFAAPLTFAWRDTTGGSHGTSWVAMREPPVCLMIANVIYYSSSSSNGITSLGGTLHPLFFRGFTITFRYTTLGRTPLDEWSARSRDLYLT